MEELRDASIHHTAQKLAIAIKSMKNYDEIFKKVQVKYYKSTNTRILQYT